MKHTKRKGINRLQRVAFLFMTAFIMLSLTACTSDAMKAYEEAKILIEDEDYQNAIETLTTVIDEADVNEVEELDAKINALYFRGDCYHLLGQEELSQADYNQALQLDTIDTVDGEEVPATRYLRRGLLLMLNEDYEGAIASFDKGLACKEVLCEQELRYNSIISSERLGDYQSAYHKLAEYVTKYPDDADMQKEYAFLRTRLQTESETGEDATEAEDPEDNIDVEE